MTTPSFQKIIGLREEWRKAHQQGDEKKALRLREEAGLFPLEPENTSGLESFSDDFQSALHQYGREWERKAAQAACAESLSLYWAYLCIHPKEAKEAVDAFEQKLLLAPFLGGLLFFESLSHEELSQGKWHARAAFVTQPGSQIEKLQIESFPGVLELKKIEPIELKTKLKKLT